MEAEAKSENCKFLLKSVKGKNIRKRAAAEESDEEQQNSAVVQKSKLRRGGFSVATGNPRKNAVDEETKAHGFIFDSSRDIQTHSDGNATATLETETEFDKDARALRERMLKKSAESLNNASATDGSEGKKELYKGFNNYTDHFAGVRRENSIAGEKAGGAHGPLRASQHIRMSVRIDYQPDVCKDYKETGYCGFGDSCKFLHDRGDYKSGWELERDWEESQKAKKQRKLAGLAEDEAGPSSDNEDDDLPFACLICREVFSNPVVTKCKHYYCEQCALQHYKKTKNCFVCNKPTQGIFNTAHAILKRATRS